MILIPFVNGRSAAKWLTACAVAAVTVAASSASAQTSPLPALVKNKLSVADTCAGLAGTKLMGGTVTSATMEAATAAPTVAPGTVRTRPSPSGARPAHCLVTGLLNDRVGIDGKPYGIRFELRLPADWNGRFLYQGGGGVDGQIMQLDGAFAGQAEPSGLMKGYAVVATDSGHQIEVGPVNGSYLFGADPQARDEYALHQIPMVHAAATRLISIAYGAPPARSYFAGVSNGGRQAMLASQQYPTLFDGIAVGMPGHLSVDLSLQAIYRAQLAARLARATGGRLDSDRPLSAEKIKFVSDKILEECDALDGARDGMVFKALSCKVDPMKWVCPRNASAPCLNRDEAIYVRDFLAGPKLRNGQQVYARSAVDPNIVVSMDNPDSKGSLLPLLAGFLSHIVTTPPTITTDLRSYLLNADLDQEYAKTRATNDMFKRSGVELMNAGSPDLDAFMRHGGKLIITTGAADQVVSAVSVAEYMDQVHARYGKEQADRFARLYITPGYGHTAPYKQSTSEVDSIQAVVDWVERGKVPEIMMATALADADWPGRTRPLCTYPKVAIYSGRGSIEDGANFRCE